MLLIYLPFRATDWICCCFICNLMAIMIPPPDGKLSPTKVKCVLVNPALRTSHVCCILDKMDGALMLPETGSVFGILRSYNWNSTLVVIDGVCRAHEYTLSNGYLDLSSCWSHDPEAMPQSDPSSLSWAASDPASRVFDDGGKGFPTAIFTFQNYFWKRKLFSFPSK